MQNVFDGWNIIRIANFLGIVQKITATKYNENLIETLKTAELYIHLYLLVRFAFSMCLNGTFP